MRIEENKLEMIALPRNIRCNGRVSGRQSRMACPLHPGISRLQSEELLLEARDDGSFLVRPSESLQGAFVLCLLYQMRVHQYRILPEADGKLAVQSEGNSVTLRFATLDELIAAYIRRGDNNGLVCALRKPVPPPGSDPVDADWDDSEDEDFEDCPPRNTDGEDGEKVSRKDYKHGLLHNFSRLDLSCCDGEFVDNMKQYIDSGLEKDARGFQNNVEDMREFQTLLSTAARGLEREIEVFRLKLSLCRDILTRNDDDSRRPAPLPSSQNDSADFISTLVGKLGDVKAEVVNLEKKAREVLKDMPPSDYDYLDPAQVQQLTRSGAPPPTRPSAAIPLSTFEVKMLKPSKVSGKVSLTVDIKQGRFFAVKPTKDFLDSSNTFSHDKILQLVKSTSDSSRLDVVMEGKKKYTYQFESAHARENFCLQIRQMKAFHCKETEVDQISIFIGTWNMGKSSPNHTLKHWLKCSGEGKSHDNVLSRVPHDVYVIGTQESGLNEKDMVNMLKASLKATLMVDVDVLETCTLWGLRIIVLINPDYRNMISHIQKDSVRTGIANALGNKGAVAVSFHFNGTSFCFVNAHLTSGDERLERRNQNFKDIVKGLHVGQKSMEDFDVTHKFHHVFFFGDLNYRVQEKIDVVLKKCEEWDHAYLLERDQLRITQFGKKAFIAFNESEIAFRPTYRLERNKAGYHYDWRKVKKTGERINVPSWCDRVLWHSYPGTFIENTAYGSADNLLNSDHRPVFSSFSVGIASQFVQNRTSITDNCRVKIIFDRVEAQVKTSCSKQNFLLEFYSSCLQDIVCCEPNTKFGESSGGNVTCPEWSREKLPELRPLFGDQDFLEDQHILIAVRRCGDNEELYGECVISLKNMFSLEPQPFESMLTHNGEETGKLRGTMHVLMGSRSKSAKMRKTYELVALDTEYHDPEEYLPDAPRGFEGKLPLGSTLSEAAQPPRPPPSNGQTSGPTVAALKARFSSDETILNNLKGQCSPMGSPRSGSPLNGAAAPPVPTRSQRPFMGQSILQASQRQVMPVVNMANNPGPPQQQQHRMQKCDSEPSGLSTMGVPVTPSAPFLPSAPSPTPPSDMPPPLPRKTKYPSVQMYEELSQPKTVAEWLGCLGLPEYTSTFLHRGWDSIALLPALSGPDLVAMGIRNQEHLNRILQSIQELKI